MGGCVAAHSYIFLMKPLIGSSDDTFWAVQHCQLDGGVASAAFALAAQSDQQSISPVQDFLYVVVEKTMSSMLPPDLEKMVEKNITAERDWVTRLVV